MHRFIQGALLSFLLVGFSSSADGEKVHITFVQANDVYEMSPVSGGEYGGLARVQTIINQLKAKNPNTYSVFAGDMFSPSAIGTAKVNGVRLQGKQMVDVLNTMGWDFFTIGNHEFDNGYEALVARLAEAEFNIFSSNIIDNNTGKPLANTQQEIVFEAGGIKVGMAGVVLPSLSKDFIRITDPMVATREAIATLREKHKVDVLVLVTHQDIATDVEFASQLDVDLIMGGHEHENIYVRRGESLTPIAKADANARSVYIHDLYVDKASGEVKVESRLKLVTKDIADDPKVQKRVSYWKEMAYGAFRADGFEPDRVVAKVPELDGMEAHVRNGRTNLTDLVANSALKGVGGAKASLLNAGSIRIDDMIPAGNLTEYDVIRILPFGGDYSLINIPGNLLIQALKVGEKNQGSGGYLQYAGIEKSGDSWLLEGNEIQGDNSYPIAIATFLIDRGDQNLEFLVNNPAIEVVNKDVIDSRAALIQYLTN